MRGLYNACKGKNTRIYQSVGNDGSNPNTHSVEPLYDYPVIAVGNKEFGEQNNIDLNGDPGLYIDLDGDGEKEKVARGNSYATPERHAKDNRTLLVNRRARLEQHFSKQRNVRP